jgi:endo-1,3-1,4-beta-glycanase ExoK
VLGSCLFSLPALAKPWKGAELISKQNFEFGAFEARIRAARGSGLITPFFLWKNNSEIPGVPWQEQDFEIFGRDGRFQTQLMTPGSGGEQRRQHLELHSLPTPAWERYYTYRMEWTPERLAFYVDGELIRQETDQDEFSILLDRSQAEPAQLRMSLWAGDSDWAGFFDEAAAPAAVFVDWVQVSSYTPGSGAGGSDFSPLWRDDFNSFDTSRWWTANWTFDHAVNDYIGQNASTRDGKLILLFTDEDSTGQFPNPPADTPAGNSASPPASPSTPLPPSSAPAACSESSAEYSANEMVATVGADTGDGWNLWSAGTLSTVFDFVGGEVRISVSSRGQFAAGRWPQLTLLVDGAAVGEVSVDESSYQSYDFFFEVDASTREVSVRFDNDYYQNGEDRNLFIEGITIAQCSPGG